MKAIAAMSLNRVIGANGTIPWHLSDDLKFFKRTTLGHVVLMGRKTFESIGRPLPGRENWVLTRDPGWPAPPGVRVLRSPAEIPRDPGGGREVFVIGGAALYEALLPHCGELYLTLVKRHVDGDTFFPDFEAFFPQFDVVESGDEYEIRRYGRSA